MFNAQRWVWLSGVAWRSGDCPDQNQRLLAIIHANCVYRQDPQPPAQTVAPDLPHVAATSLLALEFPLTVGKQWWQFVWPGQAEPVYDRGMVRKVSASGVVLTPARLFGGCYLLEEVIGGTRFKQQFCPGVGIVDRRFEHHGTPFGAREILVDYSVTQVD